MTPVVGTVMILGISAFGIAVVMTWGLPSMQQTQADSEIEAIFDQFLSIEEIVQNVMRSGASGKASAGALTFSQGELRRAEGTLIAVSAHQVSPVGIVDDSHRYRLSVTKDSGEYTIIVDAVDGAETDQRFVEAHSVDPDTQKLLRSVGTWTNDRITLTIPVTEVGQGSLRVTVQHEALPDDGQPQPFILMQSWILPLGSLEYTRQAPFGETTILLEMGSVAAEYGSGKSVHTDPIVRRELDGAGETRFLSVFAPVMTGGPEDAPLEASGGGTYEIRFLLNLNMLQIPGVDVREADIQFVGPRADAWYEHFEDRHNFTLQPTGGPTERAVMEAAPDGQFEFAFMESRFHLGMQSQLLRLD